MENVTEYKMCVLIFCTTLPDRFITLRITERNSVTNVRTSSYKVPNVHVTY